MTSGLGRRGVDAGALTGNLIAKRALAGWIVVALMIAATVANPLMFPHPIWMAACGIVLPIAMGWVAQRAMRLAL